MMAAQRSFTEDARSDLKRYLRRVRNTLRPHPSVDADEVELEIKGHIEAELAGEPEPVTAEALHGVLERLGSPNDWIPDHELPAWRRMLLRLSTGPEDWRLAYISLGLFLVGLIPVPVAPLLLLASFLVARAGLRLLEERGEPFGARKWFFYPPLLFVYLVIVLAATSMAAVVPLAITDGLAAGPNLPPDLFGIRGLIFSWISLPDWLGATLLAILVGGSWVTVLALILARLTGVVRTVFWPFAEQLEKRHGIRIAAVAAACAAVSGVTLALMA